MLADGLVARRLIRATTEMTGRGVVGPTGDVTGDERDEDSKLRSWAEGVLGERLSFIVDVVLLTAWFS